MGAGEGGRMSQVAVAMIVRDAGVTLRPCLESIRPHVDFLAIVDTGSTDESPAIAQEFADKWERYTGCNVDPRTGKETDSIWDFADARNRSFTLVPDGMPTFWCDADDTVEGAEHLRTLANSMPPEGNSAVLIPYEYSYDNAGRPTCIHWRERLIRPAKDFTWTTPCHEVCVPKTPGPMHTIPGPQVVIKHRAQEAAALPGAKPREPGRNLRILTAYLQRVHEGDPRAMYYTGVEYARAGQFGKAREVLRRYVQLSNWDDERCLAELELARIYLHEGECQEAIRWAMQAMTTKDWPNPYWVLVQAFFRMAVEGPDAKHEYNLARAVAWADRGRPLKDAETVLFYDPTERFTTDRTVARILAHWGEIDHAAEACRRGLAGIPGDPDLMEQLRAYERVRIGRDLDTALSRLVHLGALEERAHQAIEAIIKGEIVVGPANDTTAGAFTSQSAATQCQPYYEAPRWQVKGYPLVIGGPVCSDADWQSLATAGITHCISLTDPPDVGVPMGKYMHAPIPDEGQALDGAHLDRVVGAARSVIDSGGMVYLHCWVGRSRSASFAYAVLRSLGLPANECIVVLGESSPHGFANIRNQVAYIESIEAWLGSAARHVWPNRIGSGEAVDMATLPAVADGKLDIVIVTGPAFEDWTPETIAKTGIGGSETMAWDMARGLAKLGHRVRHYGWCRPEQEGVYEGEAATLPRVGEDTAWVTGVRETYANALYHYEPTIQVKQWAILGHPIVVGASVLDAEHWQRMKERDRVTGCVNVEVEHSDVGKMEAGELCEEQFPDDGSPIAADQLERISRFAREKLEAGGRLYVHCQMGGSRSPAVAYAILRSCRGLSPKDALAALNVGFVQRKDAREEYGQHPVHKAYIASVERWLASNQSGGVHWYDSARYRDIECDALVVSRYADMVQCVGGTKAKARLLWVHDVHCGAALTPAHALRFDRFLCLSNWHKEYFCSVYPFVDPERVTVTRNGIDLSLFEQPTVELHPEGTATDPRIVRNPRRAVYSSSPDRGLQTALDLWPLIRAEVPEAELHVFYGFDGLRKTQPPLADALEAKAKATGGVVLHGRVNPPELAREFMRSGVWFYPTWFSETSCLTAMQAQAAGLRIVTSPLAALNETVAHRGTMADGAPGPIDMQTRGFVLSEPSPEYRSACVRAVVKALTDPDGQGEREAIQYAARREFGLEPLCAQWSEMLTGLVAKQEMPRFYVDPAMAAVARETDETEAA